MRHEISEAPKREFREYTENSTEVYEKAGLFFGVLCCELGAGSLTMEIRDGVFHFSWTVGSGAKRMAIVKLIPGIQFCFALVSMVDWASDCAKEMRSKMTSACGGASEETLNV